MSKFSPFYLFTFLLFTACGNSDTRFRINGKFNNMNQAEFYLINLQEGSKDTLGVLDGRFTYETTLTDTATLLLIFPNYSELPIIAEPGHDIDIKGDASHLKETTVEGSKSNELLTTFRLKTNDMMPPDVISEAEAYIRAHAASPVATYLLRRYFVIAAEPDYPKAYELCSLIREAQPTSIAVAQLHNQLEALKEMRPEGTLPDFSATDTEGHEVSNSTLKAEVNVVCLWSSWNYDSQSMLRQLNQLQKDHPGKLSIISISIDATPDEGRQMMKRDSLKIPNVCDGQQWESPVIGQLGLGYVPDNIVTDSTGTILARSLNSAKLKEKIEQLLN